MPFKMPENLRLRNGFSEPGDDFGNFLIPPSLAAKTPALLIQASSGLGWEHVSVSVIGHTRCPTWQEMCKIKELFWDDEDAVMQLHPPKSEYVNNVANCLHLWRPTEATIPLPDSILVGIKGLRLT